MVSDTSGKQKVGEIESFEPISMNKNYLIFTPGNYKIDGDGFPLMIFLHGAGERGNDLEFVKRHGPPKIILKNPSFSFILVSPQCKAERTWVPDDVINLVNEIKSKLNVDETRIYLTGLSMGGFGTWGTAIEHPDVFAAIMPICGGSDPSGVCAMKDVPIWAFHGAKDNVVPIHRSEEMVDALKKCGGNPLFTVYPNATHDSWTETYNNPEIYSWLLKHKKEF